MVINHLLSGMILQVGAHLVGPTRFLSRLRAGCWKEQRVASTLDREISGASWMIPEDGEVNDMNMFEGRSYRYMFLFTLLHIN